MSMAASSRSLADVIAREKSQIQELTDKMKIAFKKGYTTIGFEELAKMLITKGKDIVEIPVQGWPSWPSLPQHAKPIPAPPSWNADGMANPPDEQQEEQKSSAHATHAPSPGVWETSRRSLNQDTERPKQQAGPVSSACTTGSAEEADNTATADDKDGVSTAAAASSTVLPPFLLPSSPVVPSTAFEEDSPSAESQRG